MATDHVTKEVLDLHMRLIRQQYETLLEKQEELLAEQKKTNGKVRAHDTAITRIWAIGTTAWGLVVAYLAWAG
jgi:uncharacterized protein involved in exopolysaccharide biosynthesis